MLIVVFYFIPALIVISTFVMFVYMMVQLQRIKAWHKKALVGVLCFFLLIPTIFTARRIANVLLSQKGIYDDEGSLVFQGHTYIPDNNADSPYSKELKVVGMIGHEGGFSVSQFLSDLVFPLNLYVESNDTEMEVLWEIGYPMMEFRYVKIR